jgi:hypothetical protein
MYCQSCGNESIQELNYCNRCGANFSQTNALERPKATGAATVLSLSVAIISLGGIAIILGGLAGLKSVGFSEGIMGMFMLFSFLILGITDILLVRQLSHLLSASQQSGRPLPQRRVVANELNVPKPMGALHEPVPSVTEHTTRIFEPSFKDPRP